MTSSDSNEKKYTGLKQITLYAGPVFRFGETEKAIAIGVSKALYMDEVQPDKLKKAGIKKNDLENDIGAYIEYQSGNNDIFFIRLEVEKIDIISEEKISKDTVASISLGKKF